MATDTKQLQHSVGAIYGVGFDGRRYLQRFFNWTYELPQPGLAQFVDYLFALYDPDLKRCSSPLNKHKEVFQGWMEFFDLDLRSVEQCFDLFRTIIADWPFAADAESVVLIPTIVAHQQRNDDLMKALERGDGQRVMERRVTESATSFSMERQIGEDNWRKEVVELHRLLLEMFKAWNQDLGSLVRKQKIEFPWVAERLEAEFRAEHPGRSLSQPPAVTSRLRSYPELVRSAGRLVLPVD